MTEPYESLRADLILREHLAINRTVLANERTLLAYVRTALALLIAGVSAVHFLDVLVLQILGWAFIPLAVVTFLIGAIRYRRMDRRMRLSTADARPA